ncbi:MAG TPA: tetratricopeptide repeat protein [Nitrospiraceae bacterium]|nr:tetratricopeptide repeat protein [Nitrospiraceae bacterium]
MRRMIMPVTLVMTIVLFGCASERQAPVETLRAPSGTAASLTELMERGNSAFAAQNWSAAKETYAAVIRMDPLLAEAHYNLALTLDRLGDKAESRKHYVQAANLAPGNKIIWNAPPLRKFDQDRELSRKSFMDPNPR